MKRHLRHLAPLAFTLLFLAACSQVTSTPSSNLQVAAATQMPLPSFNSTFQENLTRGFWFQAPVDFRITGLRVPNEAGQSLQNVEVFKLSSPPPEYPTSAAGGQVFYKTGVPSGEIIQTDLSFVKGDYVGVLGATGDASNMYNSYASVNTFNSSILGEPVVLKRLLTQSNLVASGGDQPYSAEAAGSIARVEIYVDDGAPEPTPDIYTIDFETAPTNKILWNVKVGQGVVYSGTGTANKDTIRVDGFRYQSGKKLGGNQAKVINVSGSKVLTVVKAGTNTPNPTGGELDIKPAQSFGGPSNGKNGLVTLKSITVSGVSTNNAKLVLYGNGQPIKTLPLSKTPSQTLTLDEPGVGFIQVRANDDFTVDDVVFEIEATGN